MWVEGDAAHIDDPDTVLQPSVAVPADLIAHARQRHGLAGAVLAGAMVGLQQVLDPRVRDEPAVVVEAAGEPGDIDEHGISITLGEHVTIHTPAPSERGSSAR
jgi:hypothetical protein